MYRQRAGQITNFYAGALRHQREQPKLRTADARSTLHALVMTPDRFEDDSEKLKDFEHLRVPFDGAVARTRESLHQSIVFIARIFGGPGCGHRIVGTLTGCNSGLELLREQNHAFI